MTVYGFNIFTRDGDIYVGNMVFDDVQTRNDAANEIEKKMSDTGVMNDLNLCIEYFEKHINSKNEDYSEEMDKLVTEYSSF